MSVINQMLSRLDERRAATPDTPATAAAGVVVAVPQTATRRLGLMVLTGIALVSAAAFGQWPALMGQPSAAPQPVVIAAEVAADVAAEPAPWAAAAAAPTPVEAVDAVAPPGPLTPEARESQTLPAASTFSPTTAPLQPTLSAEEQGSRAVRTATVSMATAPATAKPLPAVPPTTLAIAAPTVTLPVNPLRESSSGNSGTSGSDSGTVEKRVIPPSPSQRAAFAYRQALDNAASGHSHPAIDQALEALKADPDHAAARELAAVLMIESKRLGDAAALMREGLERQPQQPRLTMLLARIDAESGATQTALDRLDAASALDAEGHGLRAALLTRAERYREAASAYESAVRLQPDNASWWFGLGVALEAHGQAPLARQALQRARAIGSLRGDALAHVEQKLASRE